MKYFNLIKVSLIIFLAALSSCKQNTQLASKDAILPTAVSYDVNLNNAVFLKEKSVFNLHWDSNIPLEKVAYNILINDKVVESNISKTIINDNENTIEFNVPQTDYSLLTSKLDSGLNTVQIEARYEEELVVKSNKISINNSENAYLASR